MPHPGITRPQKFFETTSETATKRLAMEAPSGVFMFMEMESLPEFQL